jgi:hypothetical protein
MISEIDFVWRVEKRFAAQDISNCQHQLKKNSSQYGAKTCHLFFLLHLNFTIKIVSVIVSQIP